MNILITGGSRGIGAEAVRYFAAQGHRVRFLYASSREKAEALARETGAEAVQCDVADGDAVKMAVAGFDADALINNAALAHYGLINQIDEETWNRLFAVNVNGIYHCVNAVLPSMLHKQRGVIVNVASMWGQVGASCEVCYSATKGAVIALTKALAKELAQLPPPGGEGQRGAAHERRRPARGAEPGGAGRPLRHFEGTGGEPP